MALYSPNDERIPLPDVIDPPDSVCYLVRVPNDRGHLRAFFGVLFDLTQWINWERDGTTKASQAARVWRKIWTDLQAQSCEILPTPRGAIVEEQMPIRVDCDCNVFVDCCDGTQRQLVTTNMINNSPQPPPQPQPPPGACSEFAIVLSAANKFLLPVGVGGGDTIEITELSGGWYDGGLDVWRCPTSVEYLFGSCGGTNAPTQSTDPCPALPHMQLIASDGTNCYNASANFTVNAGIPDGTQLVFQANDSDITNNAGSASFHVKICKSLTPKAFYYGLWTNIWVISQNPPDIHWTPITLGETITVTSLTPDDPSHPDNKRAFFFMSFGSGFDPNGFIRNDGAIGYKLTVISLSGASFDSNQFVDWMDINTGCSGAGTDSGWNNGLPTVPVNQYFFQVRSHTQFVVQFRIDKCS